MKNRILQTLQDLRAYAQTKAAEVALVYHEEDSHLIRFANSAVSLNTNERLIRLEITAFIDHQKASYELITNLDQIAEMKQGIDTAVEMARHAQPLTYRPTVPEFAESFSDESAYDEALAVLASGERVAFFNQAVEGLETDAVRLSGIFSSGTNILAQISTRSEHTQYFQTSDAQVTVVLSHNGLKWEVIAEQSAQRKAELNPAALRADLGRMVELYSTCPPVQLPLGKYDIIFGPAATATMIEFMRYIGVDGGALKRGYSFLSEKDVQQQVFSPLLTLADDATRPETFPVRRDLYGRPRGRCSLVERGVFQGFIYDQDDADEFGAAPTGHSVPHLSLAVDGGTAGVNALADLIAMPRERDLLYIPFLHYTNIVNPSKGLFTGSSRFGALLLRAGGAVQVPYNVRLTQSLLDTLGERVAWISEQTVAYNTSHSYGARNPTAVIVPRFMQVNELEISHSNSSY